MHIDYTCIIAIFQDDQLLFVNQAVFWTVNALFSYKRDENFSEITGVVASWKAIFLSLKMTSNENPCSRNRERGAYLSTIIKKLYKE